MCASWAPTAFSPRNQFAVIYSFFSVLKNYRSTDSTLKLWSLQEDPENLNNAPVKTYSGHHNEKNFIGLALSPLSTYDNNNGVDGDLRAMMSKTLIACGSETNTAHVYGAPFSQPLANSHFGMQRCPLTGVPSPSNPNFLENTANNGQHFVSAVSWTRQNHLTNHQDDNERPLLLAANSQGVIKIVQPTGIPFDTKGS